MPQWARDKYLKPFGAPDYFDDAGASTHLFGAVVDGDGQMLRNFPIMYSSDNWNTSSVMQTKEQSGWANLFMSASSAFYPAEGQRGPWRWMPDRAAVTVAGGGLPNRWHVSTFVVWEQAEDVKPPIDPPAEDCTELIAEIQHHIAIISAAIEALEQA